MLTADAIGRDIRIWREIRAHTCQTRGAQREARLACLDGVMARIVMTRDAVMTPAMPANVEGAEFLLDPATCETEQPPRLLTTTSPELVHAMAEVLRHGHDNRPFTADEADALDRRVRGAPCAASVVRLAGTRPRPADERRNELGVAEQLAQDCGDDRFIVAVTLPIPTQHLDETLLDKDSPAYIQRAEALARRVRQPELEALIETLRASVAIRAERYDEGIDRLSRAMQLYDARARLRKRIGVGLNQLQLRRLRARPEDLASIPSQLGAWRAELVARFGEKDPILDELDRRRASWLWATGDIAASRMIIEALPPGPLMEHRRLRGRVVDAQGRPVSGARVYSDVTMYGDAIAVAMPTPTLRTTRSRGDGTFVLAEGPPEGLVIAQHGELRSEPQPVGDGELVLTLAPTSRLEGKVDLGDTPAVSVTVLVRRQKSTGLKLYAVTAPVHADGTFVIEGAPRGPILVQTSVGRFGRQTLAGVPIVVDRPLITGIELAVKRSQRTIHVLVRSQVNAHVPNAQVVALPGKRAPTNLRALANDVGDGSFAFARSLQGEQLPREVLALAKPGDLHAIVHEVPDGEASVCAIGLSENVYDSELRKQLENPANLEKVSVPCVPLAPAAEVLVIETPPWPRLD
jgi:hypothetical protein